MVEQTLWTSYTPATTNATDAQEYALGTTWYAVVSGWCLGAKWRFPDTLPTGSVTAKLWSVVSPDNVQANATELASATFVSPVAGVVNEVRWASPVVIAANTMYVVSIKTADRYVVSSNYFTSGVTSGDLRSPQGNTDPLGTGTFFNGKLNTNSGHLFPHLSFTFSNYWVDTIFTTDDPNNTAKSSSDTGTVTDAGTLAVAMAAAEAAVLSDLHTLLAGSASSDSGTLAETWSLTVMLTGSDSATSAEASGSIGLISADVLAVAEAQSLAVLLASTDSANLIDVGTRQIEGAQEVRQVPITITHRQPGITIRRTPPGMTLRG